MHFDFDLLTSLKASDHWTLVKLSNSVKVRGILILQVCNGAIDVPGSTHCSSLSVNIHSVWTGCSVYNHPCTLENCGTLSRTRKRENFRQEKVRSTYLLAILFPLVHVETDSR